MDINCEDMEDGTCRVTYCPTEPGNYNVNIKFAEKHIPGKNHAQKQTYFLLEQHESVHILLTVFVFLPCRKSIHSQGDRRRKNQGEHH